MCCLLVALAACLVPDVSALRQPAVGSHPRPQTREAKAKDPRDQERAGSGQLPDPPYGIEPTRLCAHLQRRSGSSDAQRQTVASSGDGAKALGPVAHPPAPLVLQNAKRPGPAPSDLGADVSRPRSSHGDYGMQRCTAPSVDAGASRLSPAMRKPSPGVAGEGLETF
ncbi:uncharacterized protein PSFLO_01085 [Pseudozyma flocculosa]|uniref:Uncharacterized protein n=1 Tax=Pseudozyma flocculosa TaxID=84751 RepID=A0A5C3ETE3_9BASI|nr:uncharacterized protein PSFLO_01085 [Pseudozyma flocculosa]